MNGAPINLDSITIVLNRIYNKVCIDFNVRLDDNFANLSWDEDGDGKLKIDGSGTFSTLTDEMKNLNTAYRSSRSIDDETIYLFIVNQAGVSISDATVLGDMPRAKQFGYLFTNGGAGNNLGTTAAHEVGHGIFRLKHVFETSGITQQLLSPLNVMDYPNGEFLCKTQWDYLSDPSVVFSLFEKDEGALSYEVRGGIPSTWRNRDNSVCFLTPSKKIVRLQKEVIQASFTFGIGEYPTFPLMPSGMLRSFKIKEGKNTVEYFATFSGSNFSGYINSQGVGATYLPDPQNQSDTAIIMLATANGFNFYKLTGLDYPYFTANNQNDAIINLNIAESATLNAKEWQIITSSYFNDGSLASNVSESSINASFTDIMADMDENSKNEQYLLISKIMEYRTVYPDLYAKMTVSFNNWTNAGILVTTFLNDLINASDPVSLILQTNTENITAGYFDYLFRKNSWGSITKKEELLVLFLKEFKNLIAAQKAKNSATIDAIAATNYCADEISIRGLTPTHIIDAVECMSTGDLQKICAEARAVLIARILDEPVVTDPYERAIYKLMWTCAAGAANANFLVKLAEIKDGNNKYILGKMVTAVDDRTLFQGKNYNTMVMNYILKAYGDLLKSTNPFVISNISMITNINLQNVASLTALQKKDLRDRIVSYNYVSVTKRLFKQIAASLCAACSYYVPTDTKSVASFNDGSNVISFENKTVSGFITVNASSTNSYHPLDPILLDDKAKLLDIYDNTSGHYVPAIILYFLEKKADAKSTAESIQTGFDVLTLAIPGGQATLALKLLNYADKASAIADMLASATEYDNGKLSSYLRITSGVLGVVSIASGQVYNRLKGANTLEEAINIIDHSIVDGKSVLSTENHIAEVDKLLTVVEQQGVAGQVQNADLLNVLGDVSTVTKEKSLLINTFELEKSTAQAAGKADIASRIDRAITKIRNFSGGIQLVKTERIQNLFTRLKTRFDWLTKDAQGRIFARETTTPAAVDQLAHVGTNGELVIDNITAIENLGVNATLVESVDDVKYFKPGAADPVTEDLLFFKEVDGNGKGLIKCIGGTNCFSSNTLIKVKNGVKQISQVVENDEVLSFNEKDNINSWQKVARVFHKNANKLRRIFIGRDTILCTTDHRFYTKNGWLRAAALGVGLLVQTEKGFATVTENKEIDSIVTVFNFTVQNNHSYYVGTQSILVHNDCSKLSEILNGFGNEALARQFRIDFQSSGLMNKFIDGVLNPKAWEILQRARGTLSSLKTDGDLLKKVSTLLQDDAFLSAIGGGDRLNGEKALEDIIAANKRAVCKTCTKIAGAEFLQNFNDYLNDVHDFVISYGGGKNVGGFDKVISELKIVNAGESNSQRMEGAAHMLRIINKERNIFFDKIKSFEGIIDEVENGCKYDLTFLNNGVVAFAEFKSYKSSSLANFLSVGSSTYKQFTTYLGAIPSLENLRYYFDLGKISDINIIKARVKAVIETNAQDIFQKMNPDLKVSLLIDDFTDLNNNNVLLDNIVNSIIKLE